MHGPAIQGYFPLNEVMNTDWWLFNISLLLLPNVQGNKPKLICLYLLQDIFIGYLAEGRLQRDTVGERPKLPGVGAYSEVLSHGSGS